MAEIIIKTLITFFCIYGFTDLVKTVFRFFFSPKKPFDDMVIVIKVLNSEKTLEATVRMVIWKCLSISHGSFTPNILIVDLGSTDLTSAIAKRLCSDYSFIDYKTYGEYLKTKEWHIWDICPILNI